MASGASRRAWRVPALGHAEAQSQYDFFTMVARRRPRYFLDDPHGSEALLRHVDVLAAHQIHESAHWVQHHGTTFGQLITRLGDEAPRLALHLDKLSPQAIRRLIKARGQGFPILPLEDNWPGIELEGEDQEQLSWIRDLWRAAYETGSALMCLSGARPGVAERLPQQAPSALALAFRRDCDSLDTLRGLVTDVGHGAGQPICIGGQTLDTVDLLECGAWIAEVWWPMREGTLISADRAAWLAAVRQSIESLGESSYLRPLRMYRQQLAETGLETDLDFVLPHLALLINTALNPRIPALSPPLEASMRWADLYPPARFAAMLQALEDVAECIGNVGSPFSGELTGGALHRQQATLAQAAGISFSPPAPSEACVGVFGQETLSVDVLATQDATALSGWLHVQLRGLQAAHPRIFLGLTNAADQETLFSWSFSREGLHRLALLTPPCWVTHRGRDRGTEWGQTAVWHKLGRDGGFVGWLYAQFLMRETLAEICVGTDAIQLFERFPESMLAFFEAEDIRRAVTNALGFDVWQDIELLMRLPKDKQPTS